MGSPPPPETDEQLAAEIENQTVQSLKDLVTPQLQAECDRYDDQITQAWQSIRRDMDAFNHRKNVILATIRKAERPEVAERVIKSGLEDMIPESFKTIARQLAAGPLPSSYPPPLTSPVVDDSDRRSFTMELNHTRHREFDTLVTPLLPSRVESLQTPAMRKSVSAEPGTPTGGTLRTVILESKRTADEVGSSIFQKPKKRTRFSTNNPVQDDDKAVVQTKNGSLDPFEVEGGEFVFPYPNFGPGYFVLRCNIGVQNAIPPKTFSQHPFESNEALEHFNNASCKCHDTSKKYDADEIMRKFGFKVDLSGEDADWVENSNYRLRVEAEKKGKGRGKGKSKQKDLSLACRGGPNPVVPVASKDSQSQGDDFEYTDDKMIMEAIHEIIPTLVSPTISKEYERDFPPREYAL